VEKWPIEPGFGYSVNLHAELFAGLLPDDVGYFGEWMYHPQKSPGWSLKWVLPFLDTVFKPYVLNRGLQHLLTRRYCPGHPMPNIPLRHLDKFALEGKHIQAPDFPYPTLFTKFPQLYALTYRGIDREKGRRDQYLFEQALIALDHQRSIFAPLPDLDGFGHSYGIDASPYTTHLAKIDDWCRQLVRKFFDHNPRGHAFIISDHGMVNVSQGIFLDIEAQIGRASEDTYLYFSDANLLRIWLFNPALRSTIQTYLENFGYGKILSSAERQEYGLTSPRFGEFIYVLDEGWAFQPSTFARNIPMGMHGYHPKTASQQGVALHLGPVWTGNPPQRMRDVYHLMCQSLAGEW
jgi:hypothetical protein